MARWKNGSDTGRGRSSDRSPGLLRGVLDFELDIGVVGDVDVDPLNSSELSSSETSEPFDSASPPTAFSLKTQNWLSIQGGEFGQNLFIGSKRVALPKEWRNPDFPFVRGLPDGSILVSDTTFDVSHGKNTWILSRDGEILSHFGIGSAAVEISPLEGGLIAVAYHPTSAQRFGHRVEPQQRTAIAFFDRQGKLLTTFNHEAGRSQIAADNVRCMTRVSSHELIFIPEKLTTRGQDVENPIVFYHCATGRTMVFSAPLGGSEAVSVARGLDGELWVLLASPEGFEDQVIAFDPARKVSKYLGVFTGIFRGLTGFSGSRDNSDSESGGNAEKASEATLKPPLSGGFWDNLSGGFISQEIVSEYNWVLANPEALPVLGSAENSQEAFRTRDIF